MDEEMSPCLLCEGSSVHGDMDCGRCLDCSWAEGDVPVAGIHSSRYTVMRLPHFLLL